jgi:hypothetical protein
MMSESVCPIVPAWQVFDVFSCSCMLNQTEEGEEFGLEFGLEFMFYQVVF